MTETLLQIVSRYAEAHAEVDGRAKTPIAGVTVMRRLAPVHPFKALYKPALCLVLQGAKEVSAQQETHILEAGQALVVSAVPPDPSGADRSLIGLELSLETSRARLGTELAAAGLQASSVILRRDARSAVALVDVEGFVTDGDARLARLGGVLRPPVVLGAYAVSYVVGEMA